MKEIMKSTTIVILVTLLSLGVYAQKIQTSKRVFTNSMDNNEYTEVSSYYFDENDNKILHGKTITTCNVNNVYDANNSYAKTYNETITYSNGKKDGAYSYYDKLARKDLIELNRRKRVVERFLEESKTGSYKSGKLDGEWKISKKEKMINPFTGDENSELSKKITFKTGKVVACAQDNYNVTFADTIGLPIILLKGNYCISGQYEKYKISKNLVTNLFLRGNTEENIDEKTQNLINDIFSDSFFDPIPSISEDSIMKLIEKDFENMTQYDFHNLLRGQTQIIEDYTEEQLVEYIASLLYELHLNEFYEHVRKINEEKILERGYKIREITVKIDTTLDYINDKHEYVFFILCREPSASFNDVQNFIETETETRIASASSEAREFQKKLTAAESKFIQEMVIYCTLKDMKESGKLRYYEHRDLHVYSAEKNVTKEVVKRCFDYYANVYYQADSMVKRAASLHSIVDKLHSFYYEYHNNSKFQGLSFRAVNNEIFQGYMPSISACVRGNGCPEIYVINGLKTNSASISEEILCQYNLSKFSSFEKIYEMITNFYNIFNEYFYENDSYDSIMVGQKKIEKKAGSFCKDVATSYSNELSETVFGESIGSYSELVDYPSDYAKEKEIQSICLKFIDYRKQLSVNDEKIKNSGSVVADVIQAYSSYFESCDKSWNRNNSMEKLLPIIENQERCLDFIALRKKIDENQKNIITHGKEGKNLFNIYSNYFNSLKLSWNIGDTKDNITPVFEIQKKMLKCLQNENIKQIDKELKKQKINTLEEAFKLFE